MKIKETKNGKNQFNSLINKIARRDKYALEKFYSIYGKLIYSVALSILKLSYLADEVVNDILVKIWQLSPSLRKIQKPIGWLYSITLNLAKDKLKTEKLTLELYDIAQKDKNIEELVVKDSFFSKISVLNEEEKQIMILHFIQDLTFKSIAKEIQKPLSTVSSIYYRAIKKLKNEIK